MFTDQVLLSNCARSFSRISNLSASSVSALNRITFVWHEAWVGVETKKTIQRHLFWDSDGLSGRISRDDETNERQWQNHRQPGINPISSPRLGEDGRAVPGLWCDM